MKASQQNSPSSRKYIYKYKYFSVNNKTQTIESIHSFCNGSQKYAYANIEVTGFKNTSTN